MNDVFHHKRPFSPDGDVYANSVTRTMKGQSLETWDMFTRETLQNSWDARDRKSITDGVSFALDYVDMNQTQIDVLRWDVFGDDFEGVDELGHALGSGSLGALMVCDSGTNGLRGPSDSSIATDGPKDFVSFVRNIGRSDSKKLAGGTYGFGKGVFFIVSQVSTIVVYSRTTDEHGHRVNRLISVANANDFEADGIEYTGRHWWGVKAESNAAGNKTSFAEPFTGEQADTIAHKLGMDRHFSDERPTGTTIMVLGPDMEDEKADHINVDGTLRTLADSLTRWAWPHMIDAGEAMDPIDFHVTRNGAPVQITDPQDDPALLQFVRAYKLALKADDAPRNGWKEDFMGRQSQVWSSRPSKHLGDVATVNMHEPITDQGSLIGQPISSHIATVRGPRMIVEYYRGPTRANGEPYCGVFIAAEHADKIFARSEPAAHHQWNHQAIAHDTELLQEFWGSNAKSNPVRIFFTKLRDLLADANMGTRSGASATHYQSLTALSQELGGLISNAQGGSGTSKPMMKPPKSKSTPTKPTKKPSARAKVSNMRASGEGANIDFTLDVSSPRPSLPVELIVSPAIESDRGKLSLDAVEGAGLPVPYFVSWAQDGDHEELGPDHGNLALYVEDPSLELTVSVYQPPNCAISLDFRFNELSDVQARADSTGAYGGSDEQ